MNHLKSRIAVIGGLMLAAVSAHADFLTATVVTTTELRDVAVVYRSADGSDRGIFLLDNVAAGTYSYTTEVDGTTEQYLDYRISLFATYADAINSGAVVGMNPVDGATAINQPFESVFSTLNENQFVASVQGLRSDPFTALASANNLNNFTNANFSKFATIGEGTLLGFTDGHAIGTVTFNVSPVPEPATLLCLGGGALALLRRRRRA